MATREEQRAGQRAQMLAVARRFYLHDESKVTIATDLGISRFKVARLLEEARATGVVRIEIAGDEPVNTALAARLRETLRLRQAIVLDSEPEQPQAELRSAVGRLAAADLTSRLTTSDVLGLPWSRTVSAMVGALRALPKIPVVQLSGALSLAQFETSPVDVVRDAARVSGGPAHLFYAPLVASDAESAAMLRRQPGVAAAFECIPQVTVAVVGIGLWQTGESTIYDLAEQAERVELGERGAVGEISGSFIDAEGDPVGGTLPERIISIGVEQLRRIPEVIGLTTGANRYPVVLAAVRAGLVDSLVVDSALARALLAHE